MIVQSKILNEYGKPYSFDISRLPRYKQQIANQVLQASYDATKNGAALVNHWSNSDQLGPNSANSYNVRQKLRSRSRYEVIENNPYLKGMILTLANDFVGSGPKLEITDTRISRELKQHIQRQFQRWAKVFKLRSKLWRMKVAKVVDGESFSILFANENIDFPIQLDNKIIEPEMVSTEGFHYRQHGDVDGIAFDRFGNPSEYFVLDNHPGDVIHHHKVPEGKWMGANQVLHWFRPDRGWARGIPETTPSLPLCALLRRYTLAVVKAAETASNFAAVLESEAPPTSFAFDAEDDPFDQFPITQGMFVKLPWGHKLSQLDAKQPTVMYDQFVGSLLREIARPLLIPFNFVIGSSKDSNMASAVVDAHIYREGGKQERYSCEDEVLGPMFNLWWKIAVRTPGYLTVDGENPFLFFSQYSPDHRWRWDTIGLNHTDPQKVANALIAQRESNLLTDEDIQEEYFNRDVEDWRDNIQRDNEFRQSINISSSP